MLVIVQLRNGETSTERGRSLVPDTIASVLRDYSVTARPLDENTADPTLRSFYAIEVPAQVSVDDLLRRLQTLSEVKAAYLKPPDEMP